MGHLNEGEVGGCGDHFAGYLLPLHSKAKSTGTTTNRLGAGISYTSWEASTLSSLDCSPQLLGE
jgi:hypothetical protein